jgi:formamidopyrimidine-DNA glycosylase
MPELPEVETMRRGVAPIIGSRVAGVELPKCPRKPILVAPGLPAMRKRLVGAEVTGVDRIGKRVVVQLSGELSLVFEPRMTGLVLLTAPPTTEHLRFRLKLERGPVGELLYWDRRGLGNVQLFTAAELAERFADGRLGPDALQLSAEGLRERLAVSRRAIKVALLDQRALAGVGNLYASEALHLARLSPELACQTLRPADWRRLHAALREVLETAIKYEGSTLSDGTYRNALNKEGGYQNHHRVYDRADAACPSCGKGAIVRIVQAQRSTFYCPRCQKSRG